MSAIRVGDSGELVRTAQTLLDGLGFPVGAIDGVFGRKTEKAVRLFQSDAGLDDDGIVGPATWSALRGEKVERDYPTPLPPVLSRFLDLGYEIPWHGDYSLILFGLRSKETVANSFDDLIGAAWTEDGRWVIEFYRATCDPGTYWLKNPMKVTGTAILVPGQYLDVYKLDLHRGSYLALCQRGAKVRIYRDSTRDEILDHEEGSISEGYFGINLHRASTSESTEVNRWSAGCQVVARGADFERIISLAKRQVEATGRETFGYTLLEV